MNFIYLGIAAVASIASLVTAIHGVYFKEGGVRAMRQNQSSEVARVAENSKIQLQTNRKKLSALLSRGS